MASISTLSSLHDLVTRSTKLPNNTRRTSNTFLESTNITRSLTALLPAPPLSKSLPQGLDVPEMNDITNINDFLSTIRSRTADLHEKWNASEMSRVTTKSNLKGLMEHQETLQAAKLLCRLREHGSLPHQKHHRPSSRHVWNPSQPITCLEADPAFERYPAPSLLSIYNTMTLQETKMTSSSNQLHDEDDCCEACQESSGDIDMDLPEENEHIRMLSLAWERYCAAKGMASSNPHLFKEELTHVVETVESVASAICKDPEQRAILGRTDIWPSLSKMLITIRNELFSIFNGLGQAGVECRHKSCLIIAITGAHFKLVRNLCASVPYNQNSSCQYRIYIPIEEISTYLCSWLISTTSPCQNLKPHVLACVHYGFQTLANMMTCNSNVCNQLWPFIFKESDLVKQLLKIKDTKLSKLIVMWIFNCTVNDAARSQYLTNTKLGQELTRMMLEMLTLSLKPVADPGLLDSIILVFNNMIKLGLTRDIMDSISRMKGPGPSPTLLDPVHVTFLKVLDEYIETKVNDDTTTLPISFDTMSFLAKVINKLLDRAPVLMAPMPPQSDASSTARCHEPNIPDRDGLGLLLRIMSRLTLVLRSEDKSRLMLKGLVESVLTLLKIADEYLPRQTQAPSSNTYGLTALNQGLYRFKVNIVGVLGNLCYECREVQDEIRRLGGIPLILSQAHIDDANPWLREYTILAIRNLLEKNTENQQVVASLKAQQVVDQEVLKPTGLHAFVDSEGRVKVGSAASSSSSS
ncbi:hypothetical protein SmJEL517_g04229 [Synchytrium microbalum]|uniref:Ataxin-10 homolog n=1 Tax=Synchytrium microbalum TaxID=1806994 RepID=A0A507C575_9FUNG|nr:uncharacterized protein SmJEL517_g04229 [Synchytrium microbalum]TPX32693.1 hypothetical protein SmJEL517_g04229 [Synchytrium microbalum]